MSSPHSQLPSLERYDAVVIGGAFSGAAAATLIRRSRPEARVLVVERSEDFDFKVGEATVEISAFMLHRVLGLYDVLAREHLPKHGLRFWFSDSPERTLAEMSEVGPSEVPRLPAFQLDRSRLDQTLIELAASEGAEVLRPAKVAAVELGWPESRVTIEDEAGGSATVATRWVVDGSGRHAFLARRLGILRRTEEHPTAAIWARWRGVADMDGPAVLGPDPRRPKLPAIPPSRRLATNHFCGYGWWCWAIPLAGGETSIGLVYNKALYQLPAGATPVERYRAFLAGQPGLRELTAGATLDEADLRSYSHLPYRTERYLDRGWAMVGDAAAFLDPYYSPGLDHASISAFAVARLIEDDLGGRLDEAALAARVEEQNATFLRSYERWISALYVGKYELLGDAELTAASFLMDTALYYMGVVTPVHKDLEELKNPLFGLDIPQTAIAYRTMRFYHHRLVRLARYRRAHGFYGRRNAGWRRFAPTASLGISGGIGMLRSGTAIWIGAELHALGHRLLHGHLRLPRFAPLPEGTGVTPAP